MAKKIIVFSILFLFCITISFPSFAYIIGYDKNNINLGVTLIGWDIGAEFNFTERIYAGISYVDVGNQATTYYTGYRLVKNDRFSFSLAVEKLYGIIRATPNPNYDSWGAGINLLMPDDDRERRISIMFILPKPINYDGYESMFSPSTGVEADFIINNNTKWYISCKPFLLPYSKVVFIWGIILDI